MIITLCMYEIPPKLQNQAVHPLQFRSLPTVDTAETGKHMFSLYLVLGEKSLVPLSYGQALYLLGKCHKSKRFLRRCSLVHIV